MVSDLMFVVKKAWYENGMICLIMWSIGYSAIVTLVVLFLGVVIFNKTEKTFVDTV